MGGKGKTEEIKRDNCKGEERGEHANRELEKALVVKIIINVITEAAVSRSVATRNGQLECILNECVRPV